MRLKLPTMAIGASLCALAAPSAAQQNGYEFRVPSAEVMTRGPDGRARTVRVDGREYQVCRNERQDNCIQPRAARLGWGDWPARHYREDRDSPRSRQMTNQTPRPM